MPVIKEWESPYFVTITAKSVPAESLKKRMQDIIRGFRIISSKYRKRALRTKDIKLVGIKSLECNFNARTSRYNPHLHLIVKNKEMADIIVSEWLKLCTRDFAYKVAQKGRKVKNLERDLIETIKYGSKIFTEPDVNKKTKLKGNSELRNIYAAALDNIFKAMQGIRIFDRFGFDLPKEVNKGEIGATVITNFKEWMYDSKTFDWHNVNTGETLTKYHPMFNLLALLELHVDIEME